MTLLGLFGAGKNIDWYSAKFPFLIKDCKQNLCPSPIPSVFSRIEPRGRIFEHFPVYDARIQGDGAAAAKRAAARQRHNLHVGQKSFQDDERGGRQTTGLGK